MMDMSQNYNYLWTGESVFCHCGHHVKYHKTSQSALAIFDKDNQPHIYYRCDFRNEENECGCTGFKSYKMIEK